MMISNNLQHLSFQVDDYLITDSILSLLALV